MSTATMVPEVVVGAQSFRALAIGANGVDMELREDGDGRTFEGIAVPWDVETDLYGDGYVTEVWRSGSFNHQLRAANRVLVGYGHIPLGGDLIGALRVMRNDAKGLYIQGRISDVPAGNNALTLMTDKALRELSIGFYEVAGGTSRTVKTDGGYMFERTKANLFETALVPFGQYGRKATVTGLRSDQSGQPEDPRVARQRVGEGLVIVTYSDGIEVARMRVAAQPGAAVEPEPATAAGRSRAEEAAAFLASLPPAPAAVAHSE